MPRETDFLMKTLVAVFAFLLLFPQAAKAESWSLSDGKNTVRLYDTPCEVSNGWLKLLKAEFRWEGKDYKACWIVVRGTVLVIDDSGDVTPVPMAAFRKDEGA